jgi:hypothetical protein
MPNEIYIDYALAIHVFLLSIIAALIGYMAKAITDIKTFAFKKVASLEADIKNTNRILSQIIVDLKIVEGHGSKIAVVQSQLEDLRHGLRHATEQIRAIEIKKVRG